VHALVSGGEGHALATGPSPYSLQLDAPAGRLFVSTGYSDSAITVFDSTNGRRIALVNTPGSPGFVGLGPGGHGAVVATDGGQSHYLVDPHGGVRRLSTDQAVTPDTTASHWVYDRLATTPSWPMQVGNAVLEVRAEGDPTQLSLSLKRPGHPADRVTLPASTFLGLAADEGAQRLLLLGNGPVLFVLDTSTGRLLRQVSLPADTSFMVLDRASHRVYAADIDSGVVTIVDSRTGTVLRTERVGNHPDALAVDERHHHLFVALEGTEHCPSPRAEMGSGCYPNEDGQVIELGADGTRLRTWDIGGVPNALTVDPATGHLFVLDQGEARPWWLPGWLDEWWFYRVTGSRRVVMLSTT
jgi:DNA-binding beta-propeller fold protein YncE